MSWTHSTGRRSTLFAVTVVLLLAGGQLRAEESIARAWNEEILAAIRIDKPVPPVHARNLFHLAVCMYDAWAAYDTTAIGYIHHERDTAPDIAAARREAISYAAYRLLSARYKNSASAVITRIALGRRMAVLGYPTSNTITVGNSPAAVGNRIALDVLEWGLHDGCNETGGYDDAEYKNLQPVMNVLKSGVPQGGGVPFATDPNRWQPLTFDIALTQNGLIADKVQRCIGVTWLRTCPFALERSDANKPWIDPGGPSKLGTKGDAGYKEGALSLLRNSSQLESGTFIDISPGLGGLGNNSLGTDDGGGHGTNPITGAPYEKNIVRLGDYARVIAEYWADGPKSETPPGHWHAIANQISDSPLFVKKIGGQGRVLNDLEWDVKAYFAVSSAVHDAACAAWSLKRYYQGPRPITMIRYMGAKGQSTDKSLPSFNYEGLPLENGVTEIITDDSASFGGRHHDVGKPGEIAVYSWPGEPSDPKKETGVVRWMRAVDWLPYQRKTFNTPAFPGYVSAHSTFSRAAAEILTAMTGSEFFPGGLNQFTAKANSYLVFERGPAADVTLQWATYYDASDQAGGSRRWGGIHTPEDDFTGRAIGSTIGKQVWSLVRKYWDGTILDEKVEPEISHSPSGEVRLDWKSHRGLYYKVESRVDQGQWITQSDYVRATDVAMTWREQGAENSATYRILAAPARR